MEAPTSPPLENVPPLVASRKGPHRVITVLLCWLPFALWLPLLANCLYSGRFYTGDTPHFLGTSLRLASLLSSGDTHQFFLDYSSLVAPHPPGAYLAPTLLYLWFGAQSYVPFLSGLLFLGLVMDASLRMLRALEVQRPVLAAWVSTLCFASAPLFWMNTENYGIDLTAAAATAQALSHLMASRLLTRRAQSVLAGFWLAAGLWLKYTTPVFLAVPCALVIVAVLIKIVRGASDRWRSVRHGLLLTATFCLTLAPLLFAKGEAILEYVRQSAAPGEGERVLIDALKGPALRGGNPIDEKLFYLGALKDLWGWPGLLLLVAGVGVSLVFVLRRALHPGAGPGRGPAPLPLLLCLSAALSGGVILSLLEQKADRYMLPILSPLVVIAASGLSLFTPAALFSSFVMLPLLFFTFTDYAGYTQRLDYRQKLTWQALTLKARGEPVSHREMRHAASESLRTFGRYPLLEERYRPSSILTFMWHPEWIIEMAREAMPAGKRELGVFIHPMQPATLLGLLLFTSEKTGVHWDLITFKFESLPGNSEPRPSYLPPLMKVHTFRAPFVREATPDPSVMVVIDNAHGSDADPLAEYYLRAQGYLEVELKELGHGRIRILSRKPLSPDASSEVH